MYSVEPAVGFLASEMEIGRFVPFTWFLGKFSGPENYPI
jgi:hypothetical protein